MGTMSLSCIISEISEILVENRDFFKYHTCIRCPVEEGSTSEYCRKVWYRKTNYTSVKKFENMFTRFDTIHNVKNGQTDGRTDTA